MSGDLSHKLPGGPAAGLFHGRDLAHVHDAAFGHLARCGARTLLRLLGRVRIREGLSPDMVEIARQRAPRARFACSSLLDAELPACVAVTAIGGMPELRRRPAQRP